LELIKPEVNNSVIKKTKELFENIITLLHPFMPFITEEIWQLLKPRKSNESIMISQYPKANEYNLNIINDFENAKEIINAIRNIRKEKNINNKEQLKLLVKQNSNNSIQFNNIDNIIIKICNLENINFINDKIDNAFSFIIKTTEFFVPISSKINIEDEIKKLKEELKYNEGFLTSIEKKLNNEAFIKNAPKEVIANEKKKHSDALAKIELIKNQIKNLQ
jgi:valyl-tRNA synthetase